MNVSIRYAKALFQIAAQQNTIDQFMEDLTTLKQVLVQNKAFYSFITDPLADKDKKQKAVSVIIDKLNSPKEIKNLVMLLIRGGREPFVIDIIDSYGQMFDDYKGLIKAEVYTAYDITPGEMDVLKNRIKGLFHKEPVLTVMKDTSIIGGLRLKVGWTIYDGTIKTHLKEFTNSIKI